MSSNVQAQTGALSGSVIDPQGGVVPGVTVVANSPALASPEVVVTDSTGTYQFPNLTPGVYNLTFSLIGF
ncbi:MAG: carboxypeptidase-like regulatory domain-containing protein [Acidobacteriota bacterium]|nr:carboxypeptidase-like regulatory domain-containing protein [Acidobacteriota bacterium]